MITILFLISVVANNIMIVWCYYTRRSRNETRSLRGGFEHMYFTENEKLRKARARVQELETAVATHMNAKGHQRCWINDLELYRVIKPEVDKMSLALPCLPEFLHNCTVYWRDSQPPEARKLGG